MVQRSLISVTLLCAVVLVSPAHTADRAVVWLTTTAAALERELNAHAARGLRLAAVSDGLPCSLTVMQAPEKPAGAAAYRVVADRNLAGALDSLAAEGYTPRGSVRQFGGRISVIFERGSAERTEGAARSATRESWRVLEFGEFDAVEKVVMDAASEGYRPRLLARQAFRSWPGLSERGLLLASKPEGGHAREARVLIAKSRNIDALDKDLQTATAAGWGFDVLFTAARDGVRDGRRERVAIALSRDAAETTKPVTARLERASSFGIFGAGTSLGGGPFWDDYYAYAFTPVDRRQIWASPIRLSKNEADCLGLDFTLRLDAPRDLAWSIVSLLARPISTGGFELVYVTDQRLGF